MDTSRKNSYWINEEWVELSIEDLGKILNQLSFRELDFLLTQSDFSEFQNSLLLVQETRND